MHDANVAIAQPFGEQTRQAVVDLDGGYVRAGIDECFGERAETGADFDDVIIRSHIGKTRDASHCVRIDDEVLTERSSRRESVRGEQFARLAPRERHGVTS